MSLSFVMMVSLCIFYILLNVLLGEGYTETTSLLVSTSVSIGFFIINVIIAIYAEKIKDKLGKLFEIN